jgi:tetratricopeptide (TPR) repeat protein
MGLEMRLAKVFHRVVARLPVAAAIVATAPLVAEAQTGNVRYVPSGYLQSEAQSAADRSAQNAATNKGPLFGGDGNGQSFSWPKMPFARSKPSQKPQKVAQRPAMGRNTPQSAAYGQQFAGGQMNGAQMPARPIQQGAMPPYANVRPAQQTSPGGRVIQPTPRAAGPIANQNIPTASRQQMTPALLEPQPAAPQVAPQSPGQRLLAEAHDLSNSASTEEDFSRVIATCRQAQVANTDPQLNDYANELCSWALNRRGQLKAEAGLEEEAIRDFDESIAADDQRWRAFHNRGVLLAQAGEFEKAFDDFNRTIELKPDFAKAYSNRGALFVVAGNYSTAAEDYDQAVQLDSTLAIAHRGYARACHLMGDLDGAIRHYDSAVALDPKDGYAIASRADVLTDLCRFAEAAKEYDRAIDVDPQSGHAYSGSAWLHATCPDDTIRNTKLALERAQKGLELNGNGDAASFDTLAAAQANSGDFAAAVQSAKQAIDLGSADEKGAYEDRLALYQSSQAYRLNVDAEVVQASHEEQAAAQSANE